MKATWFVKSHPIVGLSVAGPEGTRPVGAPQFGPTELDCEASSWVDDIFNHFLPVIKTDPRIEIYVEVGNGLEDWGVMHAWIVPRVVSPSSSGRGKTGRQQRVGVSR